MSAENKSSPNQPASCTRQAVHAWKSPPAVVLFLTVAAIGLAADLWSKHAVFADLIGREDNLARRAEDVRADFARNDGRELTDRDVLRGLNLHRPLALGIDLRLSTNPGVIFGLPMPRWLVQIATVLTVVLIGGFFAASQARDRWLHVAAGLILAGALGNLYDRLFSVVDVDGIGPILHEVRDFLDFSAWHYPWVFNVADAWLVIGVAMVFIYWLRVGRTQAAEPTSHNKSLPKRTN